MFRLILTTLFLAAAPGCGSKISEANYYRVQYGMTEEEVEDVLGPPHQATVLPPESPTQSSAASTRPVERKQLTWSREGIVLRVVFTDGVVTARSAEGMRG